MKTDHSSDQVCAGCGKPLLLSTFHGAKPARQRVFVLVAGQRFHIECAATKKAAAPTPQTRENAK